MGGHPHPPTCCDGVSTTDLHRERIARMKRLFNWLLHPLRRPAPIEIILAGLLVILVLSFLVVKLLIFGSIIILGQVRNAVTGQPLAGAKVRMGDTVLLADEKGRFSIYVPARESITVSAEGFEEQESHLGLNPFPIVKLPPDPLTTFELIRSWEEAGQYGKQFDLLHPDSQRSFTRKEFIRIMEMSTNYEIVRVTYDKVISLPSWDYYGEVYTDVVEVPMWVTIVIDGQERTYHWRGHLVKFDGIWRWFRELPE